MVVFQCMCNPLHQVDLDKIDANEVLGDSLVRDGNHSAEGYKALC